MTLRRSALLLACGGLPLAALTGCQPPPPSHSDPALIWQETFPTESAAGEEGLLRGDRLWWAEGGERVWIENGRLHVKADPDNADAPGGVATVWCQTPLTGNVRIEMDAHVVSSSIGANNINVFFFYSDPQGKPLFETRGTRADGAYRHYHNLNGYIVTFLRDRQEEFGLTPEGHPHARLRLRRCPGFNLVDETFDGMGVKPGVTYRLVIERRDGTLTFAVNGERFLQWHDPDPLREGLLGLRTFRTWLWWDNIRVYQLD